MSTPRGAKRLDFRRFLEVDDAYGVPKRTLSNVNIKETELVQFTPLARKKILSTGQVDMEMPEKPDKNFLSVSL